MMRSARYKVKYSGMLDVRSQLAKVATHCWPFNWTYARGF